MSNGGPQYPRFRVVYQENSGLRECAGSPWVYHAQSVLQFLSGDQSSRKASKPLPFRLDTGAFISIIPEHWVVRNPFRLERFVGRLSATEIVFRTAAGDGQGRLARNVPVRFFTDPIRTYRFDFLVTAGLKDRDFGLISLRDVLRNFTLRTEGNSRFAADGKPIELPDLVLVPHGAEIRYQCPVRGCPTVVWGRTGLNLGCNDHNRHLVPT